MKKAFVPLRRRFFNAASSWFSNVPHEPSALRWKVLPVEPLIYLFFPRVVMFYFLMMIMINNSLCTVEERLLRSLVVFLNDS